jgi:hypothetical protein
MLFSLQLYVQSSRGNWMFRLQTNCLHKDILRRGPDFFGWHLPEIGVLPAHRKLYGGAME